MLPDDQSNCASIHNLFDKIPIAYKPKHLYESYESLFNDKNEIDQTKSVCKYTAIMEDIFLDFSDYFIFYNVSYISWNVLKAKL